MDSMQRNMNKRNKWHHLKKRYKNAVKKQLRREFFLLSKMDINALNMHVSILKDEDTLFIKREDNSLYTVDSDMYIQNGYASAGAILLILVRLSNDRYMRECYIFPTLFCLRQYLELTMKDSILFFRLRRRANAGESNLEGHDLVLLWNNLKTYFDEYDSQVNNIERLIIEFNSFDSNGELFRYGSSLTKKVLNKDMKMPLIDVDILYNRTIQLYNFFESVNFWARNGFDKIVNNQ
jgi:hypothetical protein